MRFRNLLFAAALALFGTSATAQDLAFEDTGTRYLSVDVGFNSSANLSTGSHPDDYYDDDLVVLADIMATAGIAPSVDISDSYGTTFTAEGTSVASGALNLPDQSAVNLSAIHESFADVHLDFGPMQGGSAYFSLVSHLNFVREMTITSPTEEYDSEDLLDVNAVVYIYSALETSEMDESSLSDFYTGGQVHYTAAAGELIVNVESDSIEVMEYFGSESDSYFVEFDHTFDSVEVEVIHAGYVGDNVQVEGALQRNIDVAMSESDSFSGSGMLEYGVLVAVAPH